MKRAIALAALMFLGCGCVADKPDPNASLTKALELAVANASYPIELVEVSRLSYYVQGKIDSGETFVAAGATTPEGLGRFLDTGTFSYESQGTKFLLTGMSLGLRAVTTEGDGAVRVVSGRHLEE